MTEEQSKQNNRKILVLIDGHAMIHRDFHAVPEDLVTSKGEVVNATFGFTNLLLKAYADVNPDYMAVTFDRPSPTFRHLEFVEYKAHPPSLPDIMRPQFGRVREGVETFGISLFVKKSLEGADVLRKLSVQG